LESESLTDLMVIWFTKAPPPTPGFIVINVISSNDLMASLKGTRLTLKSLISSFSGGSLSPGL
jgi:hypothetical protein